MVGLYANIMVISLDVNGLNTQIKRQDYVVIIIYVVCKSNNVIHHTNGLKKRNTIRSNQYMQTKTEKYSILIHDNNSKLGIEEDFFKLAKLLPPRTGSKARMQ